MVLDKNHEKRLASFEAQGHAAGLNAELVSLNGVQASAIELAHIAERSRHYANGSLSSLIPSAAVGSRPLQKPQGKNQEKPVRP